jgi:hypothetical protein
VEGPRGKMADKRKHVRCEWEAEIEIEWSGEMRGGRTRNVSVGGLYVMMADPPPSGVTVLIHVRFPDIPEGCVLPSVVRWSQPGEGFGAQFENLRAVEVWALNRLLHSLKPLDGSLAAAPCATPAVR